MYPRIAVDYNTMKQDGRERVAINTLAFPFLLDILSPGLEVTLHDSDGLEVNAQIQFDEQENRWCAIPDWTTRRDSLSGTSLDE